jgi:hypothetical protein
VEGQKDSPGPWGPAVHSAVVGAAKLRIGAPRGARQSSNSAIGAFLRFGRTSRCALRASCETSLTIGKCLLIKNARAEALQGFRRFVLRRDLIPAKRLSTVCLEAPLYCHAGPDTRRNRGGSRQTLSVVRGYPKFQYRNRFTFLLDNAPQSSLQCARFYRVGGLRV